MLKNLIPMLMFCFSPLSASEFSSDYIESMLNESSLLINNLSLSLLKFPKNKQQDEYLFSFCLSENDQWGVVAFGKSQGYLLNQKNQQIEAFNCEITISSEEFLQLVFHISKTAANKQWTLRRSRPCYSKKIDNDAVNICHAMPASPDSPESSAFWMNPYFYTSLTTLAALTIENFILIVVYYAYIYRSAVYTCSSCGFEWTPSDRR